MYRKDLESTYESFVSCGVDPYIINVTIYVFYSCLKFSPVFIFVYTFTCYYTYYRSMIIFITVGPQILYGINVTTFFYDI